MSGCCRLGFRPSPGGMSSRFHHPPPSARRCSTSHDAGMARWTIFHPWMKVYLLNCAISHRRCPAPTAMIERCTPVDPRFDAACIKSHQSFLVNEHSRGNALISEAHIIKKRHVAWTHRIDGDRMLASASRASSRSARRSKLTSTRFSDTVSPRSRMMGP